MTNIKKYEKEDAIELLEAILLTPLNSGDNIFKKFLDYYGIYHYPQKKGTFYWNDNNVVFHNGDKDGERFLFINGTKKENKLLLVGHVDTVLSHRGTYPNEHVIESNNSIIRAKNRWTNRPSVLGADDRAGIAIISMLIDSGHSILLTDGEEIGGIGAMSVNNFQSIISTINEEHQFMIEFDRRGSNDYKMYHTGTPKFRKYIESIFLGFKEPDFFAFTDISCLNVDISGVNLSVGFYKEHTTDEYLDTNVWYNNYAILIDWLKTDSFPKFIQDGLWKNL